MAKIIKLGIIGMSEGNGHPYSWSAIFNGFDKEFMKDCPFPVIPDYLAKRKFPNDGLSHLGKVTHIWTQNKKISEHIAAASYIKNVVDDKEEMIEEVDAILLARDDAENHVEMAIPFIKAGLPIFIDKPFALSTQEAQTMLKTQSYDQQIFSCSSLRYARELQLNEIEKKVIGAITYVEGTVMKQWETYGIHILEPIVAQFPDRGQLLSVTKVKLNEIHIVIIKWENIIANIKVTGKVPSPLSLTFYGNNGNIKKDFSDSYECFKTSLKTFVEQVNTQSQLISREETLELVEIIEKGR
jgi:predicted dehydrogenase